ncbi:MAG TPA: threonine ammonia-lyase [Myxococcota bacterium]|jgi:threonine dehydratase|nr:threonine ammonia-lyase [Myxococcota bacterium]
MSVTLEDVSAAAAAIAGSLERTPCVRSRVLSELTGAEVWLKLENLQFTASFKERGALVKLLSLAPDDAARGVVAMSRGNHAQGVAWHAKRLGIAATIVMPEGTAYSKVEATRRLGARVVVEGPQLSDAEDAARRMAERERLVFVPPYDDDDVIAGQGTVALELLDAVPELDAIVVPVGGGGLLAGTTVVASALRPTTEVVGVQTEAWPAFVEAMGFTVPAHAKRGAPTVAEGIAVARPGSRTLALCRGRVADMLCVSEPRLEEAIRLFCEIEKTVVEGAGAAGLAALLEHPARLAGKRVALVVSGGNIDTRLLSLVLLRGLARDGRLVRLRVYLPDEPGSLAKLAGLLGDHDANILEVHHQRTFGHAPLRAAEVEIVLETRSREHVEEVVAALRGAGIEAELRGE